jgi:hypothetical protein
MIPRGAAEAGSHETTGLVGGTKSSAPSVESRKRGGVALSCDVVGKLYIQAGLDPGTA